MRHLHLFSSQVLRRISYPHFDLVQNLTLWLRTVTFPVAEHLVIHAGLMSGASLSTVVKWITDPVEFDFSQLCHHLLTVLNCNLCSSWYSRYRF